MRPRPALTLGEPEVRITPNHVRLADNGLSARDLGESVDAFNDGIRVAKVTVEGKRIDLTLRGPEPEQQTTQAIRSLPVVTTGGRILAVDSLADVEETIGPTQIQRIDRSRTMTIRVNPQRTMPLQEGMNIIEEKVLTPLRDTGLPDGVRVRLSGSADKLVATWNHIVLDLLLALIIIYLVMAVLFESFLYPWIIMLSVPVAAAGGLGGLALLNVYVNQPLDMLTMLGFVILVGIVVNNAILLVHQTLHHIRKDGMDPHMAMETATRNRIRPIFMSTLTSVFGMLPLVLVPGSGSELYRGLGSVVLGGLSLSALLTMAIVPPMMAITVGVVEQRRKKGGMPDSPCPPDPFRIDTRARREPAPLTCIRSDAHVRDRFNALGNSSPVDPPAEYHTGAKSRVLANFVRTQISECQAALIDRCLSETCPPDRLTRLQADPSRHEVPGNRPPRLQ